MRNGGGFWRDVCATKWKILEGSGFFRQRSGSGTELRLLPKVEHQAESRTDFLEGNAGQKVRGDTLFEQVRIASE